MKIYIAAHFPRREYLKQIREELRLLGVQVTSSWLDEPVMNTCETLRWKEIAKQDIEDIDAADYVVLDTVDVTPRGGREFEAGYAYGTGKTFYLVGPQRSVFHYKAPIVFSGWEQFLTYVKGALRECN